MHYSDISEGGSPILEEVLSKDYRLKI